MAFYVLDDNNNKVEALDKEGVLNAIETAIRDGSLEGLVANAGFISKLKCCVSGATNKMGFITQAQYNNLKARNLLEKNTLYIITDDSTAENLEEQLKYLIENVKGLKDGSIPIDNTKNAELADVATTAKTTESVSLYTDFGGVYLGSLFETEGAKPVRAADAAKSKYVYGNQMITSEAATVPIYKAGLYVCTLAQYGTSGTVLTYFTVIISVPSLNVDCTATANWYSTVQSNSIMGMCEVRYRGTNKYLDIYEENSTYNYKFKDCRLITEY